MSSWKNAGESAILVHSSYLQPGQNEWIIGIVGSKSVHKVVNGGFTENRFLMELKIEKLSKNSIACADKENTGAFLAVS
jgi:hypothetical protein